MIKNNFLAKICIICEGYEEYEYLNKIISLNKWDKYLIKLDNAESDGNIFARYQYNYQSDEYDLVLIFGDTDRPNYDTYLLNKEKINELHGNEFAANNVFIYGNPCTLQVILQHFSNEPVEVKKANKKKNRALIAELTGIENYDAHEKQREQIFNMITEQNYNLMKHNLLKVLDDDSILSTTNFLKFANYFESDSIEWIEKINKVLE